MSRSLLTLSLVMLVGWAVGALDTKKAVSLLEEGEDAGRLMTKFVGEAAYDQVETAADAAPTAGQNAQAIIKETEAKEDNSRMLLKPPGCRPTTKEQLYSYKLSRARCAATRPSPSAETTPPTQVLF